jgi:acetate kinase
MRLLTINTGSSSLKAALYPLADAEHRDLAVLATRIGQAGGALTVTDAAGATLLDAGRSLPDHAAALVALFAWLRDTRPDLTLVAVGHRIVHGGSRYRAPQLVTPALVSALRDLVPLAHEHPALPQVACFDTAFHRDMPWVARHYTLPARYGEAGVLR